MTNLRYNIYSSFRENWKHFADQQKLPCKEVLMPIMVSLDATYKHCSKEEKYQLMLHIYQTHLA